MIWSESLLLILIPLIPVFIHAEIFKEYQKQIAHNKNLSTENSTISNFNSPWNESGESTKTRSVDQIQEENVIIIITSDPKLSAHPTEDIQDNELLISRSGLSQLINRRFQTLQNQWFWPFFGGTSEKSKSEYLLQFPVNDQLQLNCSPFQTEYNDQCYNVLQPRPCLVGQWLIEEEISQKGKCVENKCAGIADTAFFDGRCIKVRSEEFCSSGMRTFIFKSGEVECDCKDGYLYNEKDGKCFEAFRQGPCRKNQYFGFPTGTNPLRSGTVKPICVPNPCFMDGFFCNASSCPLKKRGNYWTTITAGNMPRNCVKFGSPCTKDGRGLFVIHPDTNSPFCQEDIGDIHRPDRIIGNVPTLKCAPGSRRDILGNCRTPSTVDFS